MTCTSESLSEESPAAEDQSKWTLMTEESSDDNESLEGKSLKELSVLELLSEDVKRRSELANDSNDDSKNRRSSTEEDLL